VKSPSQSVLCQPLHFFMSFLQSDCALTSAFFFFPDIFCQPHVLSRVNKALVPRKICQIQLLLLSAINNRNGEQRTPGRFEEKKMWTSGFKYSWKKARAENRPDSDRYCSLWPHWEQQDTNQLMQVTEQALLVGNILR